MSRPQAYSPEPGQRFQILCRNPNYGKAWEHCDYATDSKEKRHLIDQYRQSYGLGWEFTSVLLPAKYWPKPQKGNQ